MIDVSIDLAKGSAKGWKRLEAPVVLINPYDLCALVFQVLAQELGIVGDSTAFRRPAATDHCYFHDEPIKSDALANGLLQKSAVA